MSEVRRWKRYRCAQKVKGALYWAHKILPKVGIVITDISERGIGFYSEWKLEEGPCELKVRSFPTLRGEIRHKGETKIGGRFRYRYGLVMRKQLHSVQLSQLKRAA